MINPEIGESDFEKNLTESQVNLSDGEKTEVDIERSFQDVARNSDANTKIIHHYLTFETPIPIPSKIYNGSENEENRPSPPEQPDLKKYTSPFLWPDSRKNYTVFISCIATAITAYSAGSYSEGTAQMSVEWGVSHVAIAVGITAFCCGFAVAPMVLAPFSEINGRRPVFVASGIVYFICQIGCAVTRSYAGMIISRFLVGCGSSVFSTMVGGVISDLYHAENRNTPMALFSGAVLLGTGLGPMISGFIAQNTSWRWIFWVQVITNGVLVVVMTISFRETRGSILLSRKAKALNGFYEELETLGYFGVEMETSISARTLGGKSSLEVRRNSFSGNRQESPKSATETNTDNVSVSALPSEYTTSKPTIPQTHTQRIRWLVKSDEERVSLSKMIGISVYRPFHLLTTEPVVFFFSLWVAFAWGILYLTFGSIPLVFSRNHNFTTAQSGAIFASLSIASIIFTVISIYQEKVIRSLAHHFNWSFLLRGLETPEGRLYFACVESALLPIGLFWFGWSQFSNIPWIVPAMGIGCATMGIFSIYLATFNYLADTYHRYASSALAAQSFCRNILGGIFPLITTAMFNKLGFAEAASLLGGLAALLTVVPWVLVFYGERIRSRSKFASEIMVR